MTLITMISADLIRAISKICVHQRSIAKNGTQVDMIFSDFDHVFICDPFLSAVHCRMDLLEYGCVYPRSDVVENFAIVAALPP